MSNANIEIRRLRTVLTVTVVATVILIGLPSSAPTSKPALAGNKAVEAFCVSCVVPRNE